MRIMDGETSSRTVHLSPSAVAVLAALPQASGNPWVDTARERQDAAKS